MPVPFPGLYESAEQMASQQLGALIGAARRGNRRETKAGNRFIMQLAHSFADELAALSGGIGQTYNMAEREGAAVNNALSSYLSGQGNAISADLGQQLAFAGPDALDAFAGGARRQGQALGQQAAAFGTQQLNRVVGEEASERAFGQSLPGIAALTGIQSARQYQGQQARALQSQVDQLHSQVPGMAAQLYSAFASQRLAQMEMAQAERFHADEMAARLGEQTQGMTGQQQERFDRINAGALEFMQGFIPRPSEAAMMDPNYQPPSINYKEAFQGLRRYWKQYYPGRSDSWINEQARRTVESYGAHNPDRTQGFLKAIAPRGGGITGALTNSTMSQPTYPQRASQSTMRPTGDAIFYDSAAQIMSVARQRGASPNSVRWEGPGYYRLSGEQIVKVG